METWRFRESGPPSTRKGYAAAVSGKAANGGRRAAAPTSPFIGASAAAKRGTGPFDNLQNPRSNYAAGKRHAYPEEAPFARPLVPRPPAGAVLPFLFWTVHGPFSRFLLEEKEKMGGALHQPSLVSNPPRPKGEYNPPPRR